MEPDSVFSRGDLYLYAFYLFILTYFLLNVIQTKDTGANVKREAQYSRFEPFSIKL